MLCSKMLYGTRHVNALPGNGREICQVDGRRADSRIYCDPHFPVAGGLSWNRITTNPSTHPARPDAPGVDAEGAGDLGPSWPRARRPNFSPTPPARRSRMTSLSSPAEKARRRSRGVRAGGGAEGGVGSEDPLRISQRTE